MATYSAKLNTVYYHIPKCCGLYISDLLTDEVDFVTYNFINDAEIAFYWDKKRGLREEFWRNKECFLISEQQMEECFEFTFVRNPYERFISGFFYCSGKKFEDERLIFDIETMIENRSKLTRQTYYHIFKTQSLHVRGKKDLFIGRCERLEDDLRFIFEKLGLQLNMKSPTNKNPIEYGDYRRYYTPEILEFVNCWFREDFENFNYPMVERIEDLETLTH